MVYVLSKERKPLMPCSNVIGRILLKQKKAKVKTTMPFVIQLLQDSTQYTQGLTHGLDTGSSKIGSAVVDNKSNVVYLSEIEIRNDIPKKMKRRAMYRADRRNRKTRYRPARWSNRANRNRKDRFTPTMVSKIDSHMKEIKFVKSILPITKLIIETASFDAQVLKNPQILKNGLMYQRGVTYGFANKRAYVLHRDKYICQYCGAKKVRVQAHHIIFKSRGGSDEPENLITLCDSCHGKLHKGKIKLEIESVETKLSYATQMNSIRVQLLRRFPLAHETFGFVTKKNRVLINLPKKHSMDSVAIASEGNAINFKTTEILFKKCIPAGDYRLSRGQRSESVLPTGKIKGFRRFDKVKYLGELYFIKARMSNYGYAQLMDVFGKEIKLKPIPKLSKMKRIGARKTWMIESNQLTSYLNN